MKKENIAEIFKRLKKHNPKPTTELNYNSPFELLIAVILSAQATDKGVNKATTELFKVANTPEAILALKERGLKKHIKTIGLFNTKAKNIIKTCKILSEEYASQVPEDRHALESLPGVGRKTAVDTHIFRVSNRTGLAPGKTVLEVEKKLLNVVPARYKKDAHHWLILHGRYTCIARKPRCSSCVIEDLCEFKDKNLD